jgi:hypothetical protein
MLFGAITHLMGELANRLPGFAQVPPGCLKTPERQIPDRRHADERREAIHERAARH